MAKRGYKLQEFVAHSANVNCIKIGKKTRRHFITGGDDEIVNLWSVGKSTPITSLSGHTSPIESVAFDSTEVLVAAGASSGVVKLWDLEETKVVRTLNGHRSYCTAVEFHPFGEFFASGSMDTNLKIWDIRIKGCIHTYKGHKRAISSIKFTPDGRWVVSGGLDNVVKIWDLTAGKLLHEFKSHEGHIRSMDFHPLEFLLATGSSDKTVKFWDLESFELIGSTQPEATGVRSVTFHPDGRTLFCGLDNSLKVYSWEPVICHDTVDLRWSTLGDLCIDDGKLLGCSYNQNSIGIWAADVSQIEPYVNSISMKDKTPKSETKRRSFIPPDDDTKDIKNIYVDSMTLNLTNTKETDIQKPHRLKPPSTKIDTENISKSVESVLKCGSDVVSCAQPVTKTSEIQLKTPDSVSIETKTSQILLKTCDLTPKPSRNIVREKIRVSPIQSSIGSRRVIPEKVKSSRMLVERRSKSSSQTARTSSQRHDTSAHMTTEKTNFSPLLVDSPQTTGRCTKSNNDDDLMLDHEFFTINLRSRLTKLQMVRHFWEQNDMRGAIIVLQKLPDHAVQADVISVMLENIESLTLDLFSCLLPLLLGLLDSDTERHVNVSLEMLLKLVAVFWPVITSTISGPSAVGVNLQAETRYECCSQCHVQLQKIHKSLPNVIRRGGLTARSAQELNLILEQS